ncbi:MAG TPA: DUF6611 family protein [Mycobacterium sp.]|nr:DUF6611 family protein [Mycobacterium sp.]
MHRTRHQRLEPGVRQSTPPELRYWSRVLDGPHQWGSFDTTVSRYGVRRDRLVIYPPGISTADRRLARMWRGWPVFGAALGVLAVMFLGKTVAPPAAVLEYCVVAYVSIGALLLLRAGPARVPVRSLSAALVPLAADARERRRHTGWVTLVDALTRADRMLTIGAISRVEYEAIWWDAYERLEAVTHG